ncbi:hypothetical protein DSECCO2_284990 [anaerobic digester metagenome]
MNDGQRRAFLFVATLAVGLVLVFFDIPVLWMLLVLVIVGILFLALTGAITATDLRSVTSRLRRPPAAGSEPTEKPEKSSRVSLFRRSKGNTADEAPSGKKPERRPLFAGFSESLKNLRAGREKRSKAVENAVAAAETEKRVAAASPPPQAETTLGGAGSASSAGRPSDDPFLSLSDDELQGDLLGDLEDLDDLDVSSFDDTPTAGPTSPAPSLPELDIDSLPEGEDAFEDAAAAILADHASDLEEFTDLEGIDEIENELSSLDESDFADSELDGLEIDAGEMAALSETPGVESLLGTDGDSTPPLDIPDMGSLPPGDEAKASSNDEMAAFAAGATGSERDMLSLLASDSKKVRVKQDLSLLRDLKDVHVGADELITDLEEVITLIGGATDTAKSEPPDS